MLIDVRQWADELKLALGKAMIIDSVQALAITFRPEVTTAIFVSTHPGDVASPKRGGRKIIVHVDLTQPVGPPLVVSPLDLPNADSV